MLTVGQSTVVARRQITGPAEQVVTRRRPGRPRKSEQVIEPLSTKIVIVYMQPDGTICHSRCRQALEYHGIRGGLEADFYCLRCLEHVTLPLNVLPRIPMGPREPEEVSGASDVPVLAARGAA
jgi:hypothetical protein